MTRKKSYILNLLETTTLDEGSACLHIVRKDLGELRQDVFLNFLGGFLEEGLEGGEVSALLDDGLEGTLGLGLEVFRRFLFCWFVNG